MVQEGFKLFALYDKLQELLEDGFDIFPSHLVIVKSKELTRIVDSFPDAIDDDIKLAKMITRNKEEIIQDAKNKAERIIQEAQAERERIMDSSSINHQMRQQAAEFRAKIIKECEDIKAKTEQDCENIRMKAFEETEDIRRTSREEALKMKDGAQAYAQRILMQLEQGLNVMFQEVKNGEQYIEQLRAVNDENEVYARNEQKR